MNSNYLLIIHFIFTINDLVGSEILKYNVRNANVPFNKNIFKLTNKRQHHKLFLVTYFTILKIIFVCVFVFGEFKCE